ncbi:TonB family protein [Pseudaeromonas sp. ZJS20]|uniref:energy transducer TonB n=1 Tax=Pseudaeromonas aegiceratis TaxID=3153928 RepID=UPI00390C57FF
MALTGSLLLAGLLLAALARLVATGPQTLPASKPVPIELTDLASSGGAPAPSHQLVPAGVAAEQAKRLLIPMVVSKPAIRSVMPSVNASAPAVTATPAGAHGMAPSLATGVAPSVSPANAGPAAQHPLYRPLPAYPQRARLMRRQGTVKIRYVIGADGRLAQLRLLEGDPELARTALMALRQWRYSKRSNEAASTEEIKTVTLIFHLNGGGQVALSE